ncbi:MAG: ribonuclease J [Candidatus Dojkabacteria bacterium]
MNIEKRAENVEGDDENHSKPKFTPTLEAQTRKPFVKKDFPRTKEESDIVPSGNLRIIPLGGVEEIGINCTVYESGEEMIVVDMGLAFSEFDYYGIDHVVPDIAYVLKKRKNLKAVFITHGHLDHIGALPYHLKTLNYPELYGTHFTIELIKAKFEDDHLLAAMEGKLHVIDENSNIKFNNFDVSFFRVNHSIPQAVGLCIKTPGGTVVQTGDFKFDNSPINEPVADYSRLAKIGDAGVDILLSDSTNSLKKGHPISESDVAKGLEEMVEKAKGRVIVATFAGLVGRLYQLIEIAQRHNKKVAIAGFSMRQTIRIAQEIGYIKIPQNLVVPIQNIDKISPDKIMILTTGAQGETDAALTKMATADYKGVKIQGGDTVIISSRTIAGNDRAVQNLVDAIMSKNAFVKQSEDLDLYTSGHGYQEDQKIMLNLVKPKFFMPVHGYQYFLRAHGETARSVGIEERNVLITKRGSVIEGNRAKGFREIKKFACEPLLVSGSGVGDVGTAVLKEREQLANYGVVFIDLLVNKERKLIRDPLVISRGFVYVKNSQELIKEVSDLVTATYSQFLNEEVQVVKDEISIRVSDLLFKETEREPMIMTVVNFI